MAGVKGKSGKKLDSIITDALRLAMLREAADPAHKNRVHAMAEVMAQRAEEGDMTAVVFVTERIEGKPAQKHIGDENQPIRYIGTIERVIVDPGTPETSDS